MAYVTEQEVRDLLVKAAQGAGSMMALAAQFEMNDQFLGRIARGRDPVSETVAKKLGYRRVTLFEKVK